MWRRGSQWGVVVAPEARALRPFLVSELDFGPGLDQFFARQMPGLGFMLSGIYHRDPET